MVLVLLDILSVIVEVLVVLVAAALVVVQDLNHLVMQLNQVNQESLELMVMDLMEDHKLHSQDLEMGVVAVVLDLLAVFQPIEMV